MISSIYGTSLGYVSMTLLRMARCTDDLTLDFAPGVRLKGGGRGYSVS
jgi:hypothetical protein